MAKLLFLWVFMVPCLCQPHLVTESPEKNGVQNPKCTYTFVVPQQKMAGAVCVSTARFPVTFGVNQSEVQELRKELSRQKFEIEELKILVEADQNMAKDVEHLRKESLNMASRLNHLNTQLLHELLQSKNRTRDIFHVEDRGVNNTAEVLKLASNYRDLQEKYEILSNLINNQSLTIKTLEEQCVQNIVRRHIDHNSGHHSSAGVNSNLPPTAIKIQSNESQGNHAKSTPEKKGLQVAQPVTRITTEIPAFVSTEPPKSSAGPWVNCFDAFMGGHKSNGIYLLKPHGGNQVMQAWCEQELTGGGWTVIQRRQDGSINFFTTWHNYKEGFGNLDSEYWLGLENIYKLTNQGSYKLLIIMEDWQGRIASAEYDYFRLESETDYYRLRLGQYRGNAGDSLSWHNDKQFSTLDRDRDSYIGNCAHFQKGGWWYNMCAHSNLNGIWYKGGHYRSRYQDGVYWAEFRGGAYSLKKVSMMVKPNK
ncbi:angiopoietin-related protein 6 [Bombina bombina]|uniref:angiopoietin-related protein 6 n=1 Tax=Bombina bombina TaxID=8345 RepID=UPI00235AF472|nr:angiopoietin-related protein 6 [Bombina bombina]